MPAVWKEKLERVRERIRALQSCAVAYSGGVDSSLVLAAAAEALGASRCLAVIATSSTYPSREYEGAIQWVQEQGIPCITIVSEELEIPEFADNPRNRCYYCKKELMAKVWEQARERGFAAVLDGANADDVGDFRPGMIAAREAGVISPLKECGVTKSEIREIAREVYRLPMADKPSMACLASRFPYGDRITREKLAQVEAVEGYLFDLGFRIVRARHHGSIVRLELGPEETQTLAHDPGIRNGLIRTAKENGFTYVTLDLEGFRSGSMNEA